MSGGKRRAAPPDDLADAYRSRMRELNAVAARAGAGDGADIVHDAFLRVVEARNAEKARSPVHLLFRAAQNLATDRLRSRARASTIFEAAAGPVEAADDSPDAERALIASERLRRSLQVIDRMTEKRRTIFLLHRIEGLSYAQIARRTGVSVKTVEKQMTAAMAFLSREMSEK